MRLWTIQHYKAYVTLLSTGLLLANEENLFSEDDFQYAYDWMADRMIEANILPPQKVRYPIWAWYQWEGKRKRLDMRGSGHAKRGEKIVQLTIDVDDKDVLLSDFDLFHYPLNYWYLLLDEADDVAFESDYINAGFTWHDLQDFRIQSKEMLFFRERIIKSWDHIFELEREDDGWLYGRNEAKSVQATLWQVKLEQVVKAEIFNAK